MNNLQFLRVGTILTSVVIGGEALALLIGMHLLSERRNPWISFKNDLLLALDLVTALGVILAVTMKFSKRHPFLTAYIGFIAYFALLDFVLVFATSWLAALVYDISFPLAQLSRCSGIALIPIGGFYIFRYVIKKHVLSPPEQSEETVK